MDNPINTPQAQPDAVNVTAADAPAADATVSLSKLLNLELGKEFPDDATALKSVKDTFGYVGKVGKYLPKLEALQTKLGGENKLIETMDQILNGTQPQSADNSNFVTRQELETEKFFTANPAYATSRPLIESMQKTSGKPLTEVIADPAFKTLFDQATEGAKIQQSQSVMQSNPRLGAVTDKFSEANELAKAGTPAAQAAGADRVTEAVVEAYGLNK